MTATSARRALVTGPAGPLSAGMTDVAWYARELAAMMTTGAGNHVISP